MANLRGANPVGRDEGGRLYAAQTISKEVGRNSDNVARQSPRHRRAAGKADSSLRERSMGRGASGSGGERQGPGRLDQRGEDRGDAGGPGRYRTSLVDAGWLGRDWPVGRLRQVESAWGSPWRRRQADWISAGKTIAMRVDRGGTGQAGSTRAGWVRAGQPSGSGRSSRHGVVRGDADKQQLAGMAWSSQGCTSNPRWCGWPGRLGAARSDRGDTGEPGQCRSGWDGVVNSGQ